jgi:hypothetical protein
MKKSKLILIILFFLMILSFTQCTKPSGCVCKDGTTSNSTGSGTCSHHGGINYCN